MFFISSSLGDVALKSTRDGLFEWAQSSAIPLWMFEKTRTEREWDQLGMSRSLYTCLTALENSDAYIGIIHDAYGSSSTSHVARVAFTDLEAFHAIRLRIPMFIYVIEPSSRSADTAALLALLQLVIPKCFRGVGSQAEVFKWIKKDLWTLHRGGTTPAKPRIGKFLDESSRFRWKLITIANGLLVAPEEVGGVLDISAATADQILSRLTAINGIDNSLQEVELSGLLSSMLTIPWRSINCANGRRVWDKFCEKWFAATVWHDNHHYGPLSCLAISNTQFTVRFIDALDDEARALDRLKFLEVNSDLGSTEWTSVYQLAGTLGSVDYSLGKMAAGEKRGFLLDRAARWIAVARAVFMRS